jgi:hypothetical protein
VPVVSIWMRIMALVIVIGISAPACFIYQIDLMV